MDSKDPFLALAASLRLHLPISGARRLVVRRCAMKHFGNTTLSDDERTITITVRKSLSRQQQLDTLIHEYAHALWMDKVDWHDAKWGEYHAAGYRVYEQMFC